MKNVLRTLVFDGQVSLTVVDTTAIVQQAIAYHKLSPSSAKTLGRALSAMSFMSACLKGERGEISLSVTTDGEGGSLGVSGNRALCMRGYIQNPFAAGTEEACWGEEGALTIIRDDGYSRPFVGTCALKKEGVDASFEEYFTISEQLPTRLATCVELTAEGACAFAGVIALQPLPFATQEALQKTAETPLYGLLRELKGQDVESLVEARFSPDKAVWETRTAQYKCNCSKAYLSRVLITLGKEQFLQILKEDGAVRVHCHYCNADYEFTEEDAGVLFPQK